MKLTLGRKIYIAFGLLTCVLVVVAGAGYSGIDGTSTKLQSIATVQMPTVLSLDAMNLGMEQMRAEERVLLEFRYDAGSPA